MKKIIIILCEYGADMVIILTVFLSIVTRDNNNHFLTIILFILLIYLLIRSVFVKHILLTIIMNVFMIIFLIFGPLLIKIETSIAIYKNLAILLGIVIFTTIQVFAIIYRAFTYKLDAPIKGNKWFHKLINRVFYVIDFTNLVINVMIALIYPAILSITIIIMFSGLYNSVNYYYELQGQDLGVFDSSENKILEPVEKKSKDTIFIGLSKLNEEGYIYFSAATFFTIGYGDYTPRGVHTRNIAMFEMVLSSIISISLFAIFSTQFYEFLKKQKIFKETMKSS